MLQAARAGDRDAMVYMAKAYDTGVGLGTKMYVLHPPGGLVLHPLPPPSIFFFTS